MVGTEVGEMTALELGLAIRKGEISAEELTEGVLERAREHNAQCHSFVRITPGRALQAARQTDRRLRKGLAVSNLDGVPTAIKDLVPTKGIRTQFGSRSFRYFLPPFSGLVAQRLQQAGLVSLGKLTTSELGVMPVTETDLGGATRNPWALGHSSGGSSGGSGSVVGARVLPVAHGSDGAGSVRIPAAFCHSFGFKPSLALLGNMHGKVNSLGLSVMGPLSQSVADAAAYLDAMNGDIGDVENGGPCLQALQTPPQGLRIKMVLGSPVGMVDPRYAEATARVGAVLEGMGHSVEVVPNFVGSVDEFLPIWQFMVAQAPILADRYLQPITRWLRTAGKAITYEQAERLRQMYVGRFEELMKDGDILLSPTVPGPPPKVGSFTQSEPEKSFISAAEIGGMTAIFNLNHAPAASVPVGFTEEGFPLAVQLGARAGEDHRVLALCAALEKALPWAALQPRSISESTV